MNQRLPDFLATHRRLLVITGAGISTGSGIPDYRGEDGGWKRPPPMTYQAFTGSLAARQRYWARSLLGWPRFGQARPNSAHLALATLQRQGRVQALVTQNVDGLHQAAGSSGVIDLHGRLDAIVCLGCAARSTRAAFQQALVAANPDWLELPAGIAPDGDAELDEVDFSTFRVPACAVCGGVHKPDVVFFGESVPRTRVEAVHAHLARADAVLVVGSSLMVWSGFRFVRAAASAGLPIALLNRGLTRADDLATLKCDADIAHALSAAVATGPASDATGNPGLAPEPTVT